MARQSKPPLDGAFDFEIEEQAAVLGQLLEQKQARLVTAESCTGGWISAAITSVPGSSKWFALGLTTYSNEAKQRLLSVPASVLKEHGAVSKPVVSAMAEGALGLDSGAVLAVAVSGIAGPAVGHRPAGAVEVAWALRDGKTKTSSFVFGGSRNEVRRATVVAALRGCAQLLLEP